MTDEDSEYRSDVSDHNLGLVFCVLVIFLMITVTFCICKIGSLEGRVVVLENQAAAFHQLVKEFIKP